MKVVDWGPMTHYIELLHDLKQTDDSIAGRKSRVRNPNKPVVANENVGDSTAPAPQLSDPRRLPDPPRRSSSLVQPPTPLRLMNGLPPSHPASPTHSTVLHNRTTASTYDEPSLMSTPENLRNLPVSLDGASPIGSSRYDDVPSIALSISI